MDVKDTITIIIIAVTALATAISAIWAATQYRLVKRDTHMTDIKRKLMQFKNNCDVMNDLLCYELVDEVVNAVVFSHNIEFQIIAFSNIIPSVDDENLKWPFIITKAAYTPRLMQYEHLVKSNNQIADELSQELPSISRIFKSIQIMFCAQHDLISEVSRNEKLYSSVVIEMRRIGVEKINIIQELLCIRLIEFISHRLNKEQENINDAISIIDIANNIFLKMSDKELNKQINCESKINFKRISDTTSIYDDLQEAEKGLERIMSAETLMKFRELCVAIKIRNGKNNE